MFDATKVLASSAVPSLIAESGNHRITPGLSSRMPSQKRTARG